MGIFCDHDWQPKTGMDSGSSCTKCGATTNKEFDINKSGGLQNGSLR